MKKLCFLFLLPPLFISCEKKPERTINRSFYYWKSIFTLSETEEKYLDTAHINRLYVKFFDVTWDKIHRAVPVAEVKFESKIPVNIELVPVVFITNETLINSDLNEMGLLAARITKKMLHIKKYSEARIFREIQLDCDWSAGTREKYFELLAKIRENNAGLRISATIRLHQIKYAEKTGVPPVDKGMLMLYNMGAVQKYETRNSLFDPEEAAKYIGPESRYPLKLDLALPLYSWGVVFRNRKFLGLINNLNAGELKNLDFMAKTGRENVYQATEDKVFRGIYIRKGDEIRFEEASAEKIKESAGLLENLLPDTLAVSLYHFDEQLLKTCSYEEISDIYTSYR